MGEKGGDIFERASIFLARCLLLILSFSLFFCALPFSPYHVRFSDNFLSFFLLFFSGHHISLHTSPWMLTKNKNCTVISGGSEVKMRVCSEKGRLNVDLEKCQVCIRAFVTKQKENSIEKLDNHIYLAVHESMKMFRFYISLNVSICTFLAHTVLAICIRTTYGVGYTYIFFFSSFFSCFQ